MVNFTEKPGRGRDGIRQVVPTQDCDNQPASQPEERLRAKAVWGPRHDGDDAPHSTRTSILSTGRVLALALAVFAFDGAAHAQSVFSPNADEVVLQAAQQGRSIPVIVQYKPRPKSKTVTGSLLGSVGGLVGDVLGLPGEVDKDQGGTTQASLQATASDLNLLLGDKSVQYISYDAPVQAFQLPPANPIPVSIDGSGAAAARSRYGVTGRGITVAVIDSGVQPSADLRETRIRAFVDFVNGRTRAYDDYGHGTHVAHIIAGTGSTAPKYTGAAPSADIVALKVLDGQGRGTTSKVLAALKWVLAKHRTYNIRVVNLSLGHPVYDKAENDPLVQAVEQLSRRGVVVVAASGNLGKLRTTGQTVYGSVTSPGNAPSAVTVGAVNTNGTKGRRDDFVADFSGRGPTRFEHAIKPDLVAPGYAIMSRVATSSYLATNYRSLVNSSGFMRLNGTSMATPVVAGAAALMIGANPGLSSHAVKAVLQYTSQRLPGADIMTQGAGEVNVAGAVRLAKLINPGAGLNRRWLKSNFRPTRADLLFNEVAVWGRATIWGDSVYVGQSVFMNLPQWNDGVIWGFDDNIVWSFADNIVWSFLDNIVWSFNEGVIWGFTDDNIVWSFGDDNIVWSFDDNIVWSFDDNIVWSFDDNIVWSFANGVIWGFTDNIVWSFSDPNSGG